MITNKNCYIIPAQPLSNFTHTFLIKESTWAKAHMLPRRQEIAINHSPFIVLSTFHKTRYFTYTEQLFKYIYTKKTNFQHHHITGVKFPSLFISPHRQEWRSLVVKCKIPVIVRVIYVRFILHVTQDERVFAVRLRIK